jgi:hypothetical protein
MLEAWLFRREILSTEPGVHAWKHGYSAGNYYLLDQVSMLEAWLFRRDHLLDQGVHAWMEAWLFRQE